MTENVAQTQDILEIIFENTHTLIAYLDTDLKFLRVNEQYAAADQKRPEYFVGKRHFELYPNEENEAIFRRVLNTGEPHFCYAKPFEYEHNPERGITHWDWSLVPVKDNSDSVKGLILQLINITERIEVEESLVFQERLSSAFLESATALMITLNRSGQIIHFNRACENVSQYKKNEVLNKFVWDILLIPEEIDSVKAIFKDLSQQALPNEFTNYWLAKDGSKRLIYWSNSVLKNELGEVQFIISVGVDVSKQVEIQNELKRSELKLLEAQSAAKIGTWDWEISSNELFWSEEVFRIFGIPNLPSDKIFQNTYDSFLDQVYVEDRETVKLAVQNSLANPDTPYKVQHRVQMNDGQIHYVEETGKVDFVDGKAVRMLGIVQDITERKQVDQALRTQAMMIDQSHDSVISTDLEGLVTSWNKGAERLFGYTCSEMMGKHISIVHPEEGHDFLQNEVIQPLKRKGEHEVEVRMLRKSGEEFWGHLSLSLQYDDQNHVIGMVGFSLDITDRKHTEKALIESEMLLEKAQHIAKIGHWKLNPVSNEVQGSNELFEIFGLNRQEATLDAFVEVVHPDDREMDIAAIRRGAEFGESWDIEHRIIRPDGTVRWVHAIGEAIQDNVGNIIELMGTVQDITELRKYRDHLEELIEERTTEMKLARDEAEQANAAKSDFLSRMSHELRTPLNAILGFGQLLEANAEEPLSQQQAENIREIMQGGNHLLALVNDILDLSGIESGRISAKIETVALTPVINACVSQLQTLANERGINILFDYDNQCAVKADQTRLTQVLLNLLTNAIKYNKESGKIRVYCEKVGQNLKINVEDTGLGIETEDLTRLFQPFERLASSREAVEGTGIGLALAKKLVEAMHGKMGVESVIGKGSNFWFELPLTTLSSEELKATKEQQSKSLVNNIKERRKILYVEDNPANMRLVQQTISMRNDLELFEAITGEDGFEIAMRKHPDLILLDLNLPDIDGFEVLKKLKSNSMISEIPVIAITANAMAHDIERGKTAGFEDYLTKPIDIMELIDVFDQHLKEH